MQAPELKPLVWVGGSKKDLGKLPRLVRKHFGFALRLAQQGLRHVDAKSLRGFGGGAVIEVVEQDSQGGHGVNQEAAEGRGDGLQKSEERQR